MSGHSGFERDTNINHSFETQTNHSVGTLDRGAEGPNQHRVSSKTTLLPSQDHYPPPADAQPTRPLHDVRYANLGDYILRAEAQIFGPDAPKRRHIFRRAAGVSPPILRSDVTSRILLMPGCFNPPHLNHAALL